MLRSLFRSILLDALGALATPANGIHILNGHRIALENPRKETFEQQLKKLSRWVAFADFDEAVRLIRSHAQVEKPVVAFSFDDGFEECYTMIAPALERYGITAAFFINPNFITGCETYIHNFTQNTVFTPGKRPMNWPQIKELHSRGHIIGAHTLDHYNINSSDTAELEHQIGDCRTVIEQQIGSACDYFAFPFGRLEHANSQSINIAAKYYPHLFSQSDYKNYFSFEGRVINRRHFEPNWPIGHVNYFLSCKKR